MMQLSVDTQPYVVVGGYSVCHLFVGVVLLRKFQTLIDHCQRMVAPVTAIKSIVLRQDSLLDVMSQVGVHGFCSLVIGMCNPRREAYSAYPCISYGLYVA